MANGYTWDVKEGRITSLNQYLMRGIEMTLNPTTDSIERFRESPLAWLEETFQFDPTELKRKIVEARREYKRVQKISPQELEQLAEKRYQDNLRWSQESVKSDNANANLRRRYETLIGKVTNWVPPKPRAYNQFKKAILKELNDALSFDCRDYSRSNESPKKETPEEVRADLIKDARYDLESSKRALKEKRKEIDQGRRWYADLLSSMGYEVK